MSFIQCPDCGKVLKAADKGDNQHLQEHREKECKKNTKEEKSDSEEETDRQSFFRGKRGR